MRNDLVRNQRIVERLVGLAALAGLTVLCLLLLGCSLNEELGGENTEKLPELRRLAQATPVFPGFSEIDSSHSGKRENAGLTFFYRSSASYEEVKNFYTNALSTKGWGSPREEVVHKWIVDDGSKALTFRQGEYTIEVEYNAASDSRWQFSLDFGWEKK